MRVYLFLIYQLNNNNNIPLYRFKYDFILVGIIRKKNKKYTYIMQIERESHINYVVGRR